MSTVTVNLSQAALNACVAMHTGGDTTTLADSVDIFFQASHTFSATHPYYSSASLNGSTGRLNFADGGYELYTGIVDLTPGADNGHATATAIEEYAPNAYRLSFGGKLNFDYATTANGTSIGGGAGTLTSASLQTLVPSTSSAYNSQLGNVNLSMHGNLLTNMDGSFTGTVNSFSATAEHLLASSSLSGNFKVSGNGTTIGMGLASVSMSGTLTGFADLYADGSQVTMTGASLAVTGTSVIDERMFLDAANFSGNDVISVTLPASVTTPWVIASGSGDDAVTLRGGGGALSVNAGAGNDTIALLDYGHAVDGGDGFDIVSLAASRSAFSITKNGDSFVLAAAGQGNDVLRHVETLKFSDTTLSLEYNDVVQALYVAYFGRAADTGALANFQQQLAILSAPHDFAGVSAAYNTNAGIRALIDSFGGSDESKALYSGDTTSFVTAIYKNILSRAPDAEGLNFWVDAIDHHGLTKANASLSIMAGALSNSTTQGKLDAALIGNRTTIASDFSFAIDTPAEMNAYSGNAAAASVRAMLVTVTADTDLSAFQATIKATLDSLANASAHVSLVGIPGHDGGLVA
jgi:hypothetical protein